MKSIFNYFILRIFLIIVFFMVLIQPQFSMAQKPLHSALIVSQFTSSNVFTPSVLKGLILNPVDSFQLDFILDTGDESFLTAEVAEESRTLIEYFLAALTLPEEELWVNLSPYEGNRIISESFEKTQMGQDLLAQDYLLKQLTAELTHPEHEVGKQFWRQIYSKLSEKYGTSALPIQSFNKVWIVPENAEIYENNDRVFIVNARLKVMMEEDYLLAKHQQVTHQTKDQADEITMQIMREMIIPIVEAEINNGSQFAKLRQIYYSYILAAWYKKNIFGSLLNQSYSNQTKTVGLENFSVKEEVYQQYLQNFEEGLFSFFKDEYDQETQQFVQRSYFSGGAILKDVAMFVDFIEPVAVGRIFRFPVTLQQAQFSMNPKVLYDVFQYLLGNEPQKVDLNDINNSIEADLSDIENALQKLLEINLIEKDNDEDSRLSFSVTRNAFTNRRDIKDLLQLLNKDQITQTEVKYIEATISWLGIGKNDTGSQLETILERKSIPEERIGVFFPAPRIVDFDAQNIRDLYYKYDFVQELYDRALKHIKDERFSLETLFLKNPNEDGKYDFEVKNIASLLYAVALYQVMEFKLGRPFQPRMLGGNSNGSLVSMVVGGAVTVESIIDYLLAYPGDISQRQIGVIVLNNVTINDIESFLSPGEVELFNNTAPYRIVLAVDLEGLSLEDANNKIGGIKDKIVDFIRKESGREIKTLVHYPTNAAVYHNSFYDSSFVQKIHDIVDSMDIKDPKIPLISSPQVRRLTTAEEVRLELKTMMFSPMRHSDVMGIYKNDADIVLEIGTGSRMAIENLMLDAPPTIKVIDDAGVEAMVGYVDATPSLEEPAKVYWSDLESENYRPEDVVEILERDFEIAALFASTKGGKGSYSVREHSLFVARQFEKYFAGQFDQIFQVYNLSRGFMRLFLLLHDIGFSKGTSAEQHIHTTAVIKRLVREGRLPWDEREQRLAYALLEGDYIGKYMQGKIPLEDSKDSIIDIAQRVGFQSRDLFKIFTIYWQSDMSGYSSDAGAEKESDIAFSFEPDASRIEFNKQEYRMVLSNAFNNYEDRYRMLKEAIDEASLGSPVGGIDFHPRYLTMNESQNKTININDQVSISKPIKFDGLIPIINEVSLIESFRQLIK